MTPALKLLEKQRIAHRALPYAHDPNAPSYGLEAAQKLNLPVEQVFKTLLAEADGELLVAVVPVSGSLDLKALAHAAGAKKVQMANPQQAEKVTGYRVGGISPLGQKKRLRTFIDSSAQAMTQMYVSAGKRGLDVELAPQALQQLCQASWAAIGRND
ncbi:Cys-tRNA(Pro) deacylase [Atopomonas sediminilitoris]|uniref:Cys-tRNA(Pro) deacylase n=1 Tax=Atopomonas sediminilitoris TaxID=2919919 RepID=UPI001F4E7EED|nr:Cys-tRNA(Pro) deacylase [Atopomonas sediminilitoris]MCJ8168866.1 Cys-tRNA(Pro) deacylase [Atopomonas sediminilitoris]